MKKRISSFALVAVLMLALVLVPMFAMTVAAESATVTKTNVEMNTMANSSLNGTDLEFDDYITVRFDKNGSTTAPTNYSDGIRLYQGGGTLKITAAPGATIKSIAITAGSSSYNGNGGSVSVGTLTISGTSVTITDVNASETVFTTQANKAGRLYVKEIAVTYEVAASTDPDVPACEHTNTETVPGKAATCTEAGLTDGEKCSDCGAILVEQENIPATGHNYVDGVCSVCNEEKPDIDEYKLVTNISQLTAGSKVIIVASGSNYAMSTTQNSNNRGAVAIEKNNDIIAFVEGVQVFTLEAGTVANTFAFYTGEGYLYAASSSSNYLRTQTTNNANGSWIITITDAGVASITAQGTYTRNQLKKNSNSALFSCYGSGQNDVAIYKLVGDEPECAHTNTETIPGKDATCTETGLTEGTKCSDCGATLVVQEEIPALGHNYEDYVCTKCGNEIVDYSGRYYIATIRSSGNYWWMTSNLGTASTKRYQAVASGLTELPEKTTLLDATVFALVLNKDGTYKIYAEDVDGDAKYLGYTSGNSGALVAESNAISLNLEVADNGTFTLSYEDRVLGLNATDGDDYFAFYAATGTSRCALSLVPVAPMALDSTQVGVGADLSMYYNIILDDALDISKLVAKFTKSGKTYDVTTYTIDDKGRYVFTFAGIAPQCMGDDLTVEFYYNDEQVGEAYTTTVLANLTTLYGETSSAELKTLIEDILNYGAAAQNYTKYKTNALVNAVITGGTDVTPEEDADNAREIGMPGGNAPYTTCFTALGVKFDCVNKIYVKFKADDLTDLKVVVGDQELVIEELGDGMYIAYTDGISATEFAEVQEISLKIGGVVHQTIKYSINSYAYAMQNDTDMSELVLAMFRYGKSAVAYAESLSNNA